MSGHTSWDVLRSKMSPEQLERVEKRVQKDLEKIRIQEGIPVYFLQNNVNGRWFDFLEPRTLEGIHRYIQSVQQPDTLNEMIEDIPFRIIDLEGNIIEEIPCLLRYNLEESS